MKLQVNSEHKKCSYNSKGRKIFIKLGSVFCGVSLFSGIITSAIQYKLSEEKLVSISSDARDSIYTEIENDYFNELTTNNSSNIDYNITDKSMKNVKKLDIDMLKNDNLKFISEMVNLETIKINNAQMLSDNDLILINNSNLQNIELIFDMDDVIKNNKSIPNFKLLTNKQATIKPSRYLENEIEEYKFYHFIFDYLPNVKNYDLDYNKYFQIDNKLNDIISKININEYSSSEERVMKIVFSIINYLNYDQEIKEYEKIAKSNPNYNASDYIKQKISSYNDNLLSSSLIDDNLKGNGVCVNFSAIFVAICSKLGLEAYTLGGTTSKTVSYGHEWNYVKIADEYILIDLTAINNSCKEPRNTYNTYFNKYISDLENGKDNKVIMNKFIDRIFNYYSDYMENNYYSEDNEEEILKPFDDTKDVSYVNYYAENIKKHDVNYILSGIVATLSGSMATIVPASYILLNSRKEKKY